MTQNNSILQSYNGIIRFYDGTIIAIEDQEYSPDGLYNWEKVFNPYDHISTLNGVTPVGGHRFKRVKHAGDTNFQLPYRIIPDEPVFRVQDLVLQFKLETQDNTEWKDLLDLSVLQGADGEKGEQGIQGEGFHIDLYGYYQLRPDCSSALQSTCTSCNNSVSGSSETITFMSLGDGVLVLTSAIIGAGTVTVDGTPYTHFSNDLVTWTPLTGGIVDFEVRYLATNGTGAVYTDMRTEDYYGTRGIVYVCADGSWTVLPNIATPSYMVGERVGSSNIGFLNNFIDDTLTNFLSNTIGLTTSGKLEIAEQSIDETAFAQTIVDDGLTIPNPMDKIKVLASDFAGFGLDTYTSNADSELDIQVDVTDLLGDGVAAQAAVSVDGETRNLLQVNITDLVNNDSGIIAVAQVDTFYDLMVNLGDGLELDGGTPQAIKVKADELSLEVDGTDLHIKEYNSGNDGVMRVHLNPDIIWTNRGIGFDTANGLYARIDNATIGYDGSGNLQIPLNGLTGDRLNDNVADDTKGIEVLNDMLVVKVDGSTIGFNGSGELEYLGLAGNVVSSLIPNDNGSVLATVRDDVTFRLNDGTGTISNLASDSGTDTITMSIDVDTAWLTAQIDARIALGAATVYWGALERTNSDATTIASYITSLKHTVLNTWYNNVAISDGTGTNPFNTAGLLLKAPTGEVYRFVIDAEGNTDTVVVVP